MSIRIQLSVAALLFVQAASGLEVAVESRTSYLDNVGNFDNTATVLDLSIVPAQPGDLVRLTALGEFSLAGPETEPSAPITSEMIGVFSGSDMLLDVDAFNPRLRVVDAIEAGSDVVTDSDISQDFFIGQVVLEVPAGATHLFVAPLDGFTGDNHDTNGNFALDVTVVPEPASIMLLLGMLLAVRCCRR